MDYAAHYERLMARARDRALQGYSETHHVLPRCMGGGNEAANLVELTPEEHYVAHQLLVKMHPSVLGLAWAAVKMAKQCSGNKAFGWLRRRHAANTAITSRGRPNLKGLKRPPRSPEHRARLSAAILGKRRSVETRAKISAVQRGRTLTTEHRAKISAGMRGKRNCLGKTLAPAHREKITAALRRPETRAKMSAALKGRTTWNKGIPQTAEVRAKMSEAAKRRCARRAAMGAS